MAEPALKAMTVDEFLDWEDGTDRRYELVGGFPLAMAPPSDAHGMLAARLLARIEAALASRRPCAARSEAGVPRPDRADSFYIADIAVSGAPSEAGRRFTKDPMLLVEILSPSTERHDRRTKLPAYRQIETVQEILLIDSETRYAELYRRRADLWVVDIIGGSNGVIPLSSVGIEISTSELYDGMAVEADTES